MTQTAHPLQTHWDAALKAKASGIRLIALDVDGIMSDGRLYFSASGDELKAFNILDGLGLKQLMQAGITVAVITGRRSPLTEKRMSDLGIPHLIWLSPCDPLPLEWTGSPLELSTTAERAVNMHMHACTRTRT